MSTPNRAETNRANSQYSTGPQTHFAKKKSSLNALRHGLTSQLVVLPTEDSDTYLYHLQSFIDEFQPEGASETHLVQNLADTSWRQNRVTSLEAKLLARDADLESQIKALANLSLHSQRLSRQFEKTIVQLRDLQETRRAQQNKDLDNLLDITEMYESKGETYSPSEDGFVFSESQINESIHRRNRERLADQAYDHLNAD
jgi:hypothetical protein